MKNYKKIKVSSGLVYLLDCMHAPNIKTINKFLTEDAGETFIKIPQNSRNKIKLVEELNLVSEVLEDGEALADLYDVEEECTREVEEVYDEVDELIRAI